MSISELTPLEAYEMLDAFRIIDVREDHEFRGPLGCIEIAESVPLATVDEHAEKLRGSRPLLLACRSGKRSGIACERLAKLGCEHTTNLTGGMIAWNGAGLPVLHSEPQSLRGLVDQVVAWTAQVGPLDADGVREIVRKRFETQSTASHEPNHKAVEDIITHVSELLGATNPPDLELSVAFFRRSLAVL